MDHKQAIANKVKSMFNIEKPEDSSIFAEVHRNASISANNIMGSNYDKYVSIFSILSDDQYDIILNKEYYLQSNSERVLMACENAEANLYMYHLLSKFEFISEEDLRYTKQAFGTGSIEPEKFLDMIEGRYSYYKDAKKVLDSINWDLENVGGSSGFFISSSLSQKQKDDIALQALLDEQNSTIEDETEGSDV